MQNSVIVVIADTYYNAALLYLQDRFNSSYTDWSIESIALISQTPIDTPSVIIWRED